MLKRKGQAASSNERLSRGQLDAHNAAFAAIRPGFDQLRQLRHQVARLSRIALEQSSRAHDATATIVADGIEWQPHTGLLKLPKSTVVLCRKSNGNEFAIVQQFLAESAYTKANGQNEILLRGADASQLLREYAGQVQHTLRFMASNLVAQAQRVAFEQFPEHNPGKVVRAISERCRLVIGETLTMTESVSGSHRQGQRIRM